MKEFNNELNIDYWVYRRIQSLNSTNNLYYNVHNVEAEIYKTPFDIPGTHTVKLKFLTKQDLTMFKLKYSEHL